MVTLVPLHNITLHIRSRCKKVIPANRKCVSRMKKFHFLGAAGCSVSQYEDVRGGV